MKRVEITKVAKSRYNVYVHEEGIMRYYPCGSYSISSEGVLLLDKEIRINFDEINIKQ